MEGLLTLLGPFGAPVSFVGFLLFMYAYLRKQEAQINADLKQTIDRLKADIEDYAKESDIKDTKIKDLVTENATLLTDNAILQGKIQVYELRGE